MKRGVTGVTDILVMQENGTLQPIDQFTAEEFLERFGRSKEEFCDLVAEKVLEEEIYGV